MLKTDIKIELYGQVIDAFVSMSANNEVKGARPLLRFTRRSILRDYKKAVRIVDKKIPVFVELPEYESVGNGMVKEVSDSEDASSTDLIEVNDFQSVSLPSSKSKKSSK